MMRLNCWVSLRSTQINAMNAFLAFSGCQLKEFTNMGNAFEPRRGGMFIENVVNILLSPVGAVCYSLGLPIKICRSYGAQEVY